MKKQFLNDSNKQFTRKLYEEAFYDDSKKFVDYFYENEINNNRVSAIFEEDRCLSMMQLHPMLIEYKNNICKTYYIVAVSTLISERKKGLYKKLLNYTLNELHKEKIPFVFLMPANEAIYKPFNFRTLINYNAAKVFPKDSDIQIKRVSSLNDKMKKFINDCTNGIKIVKDDSYFDLSEKLLKALDGCYYVAMRKNNILGILRYIGEDKSLLDIVSDRLFEKEILSKFCLFKNLKSIRVELFNGKYEECDKQIKYMYRIINLKEFLYILRAKTDYNKRIRIIDNEIQENSGIYHIFSENGKFIIEEADSFDDELNIGDFLDKIIKYADVKKPFIHEVV